MVVIAVVATVTGVLLLLLSAGCCCVWRRKKRRERHGETDPSPAPPSGGGDDALPFRARKQQALDEDWRSAEKDVDLPLFDLAAVLAATGSFSASNKIGEGGFGPVYMVRRAREGMWLLTR